MGGNRFAYFSLPVSKIVLGTCSLPMFATIFCVVWSVAFDFERSTATHCKVYNFLPSISSAIGGFAPQRYVWRICVSIHCTQRFMVGVAYYNFHTSVYPGATNKKYKALAALNSLLHLVEIFSLVCLSMISSTENGGVHEGFFISFIISGLLYMLVTIVLLHWGRFSNGKIPTTQFIGCTEVIEDTGHFLQTECYIAISIEEHRSIKYSISDRSMNQCVCFSYTYHIKRLQILKKVQEA
ncbi:post-GPI attachment to proteins factor 2-like isoform X2 [Pomacea canaliculata]|uniref:post-GPI attachment to proteins factor 2-like isoform X2 n=1 Tax=Pomacea canaliculata TaxID=400727 RepID=UPI000D72F4E0|nr:post-GPI attachment to proteins factor 2-like isoform X2 [Pomacea canaliculata]